MDNEREHTDSTPKHRRALRIALIAAAIFAVLGVAFAWYVNDYYRADESALEALEDGNGITVRPVDGNATVFIPENPIAGMVFYPGGKVQPEAYAPLLRACAEQGILCVLVKPPFNLAFFDVNAAQRAISQFPDIEEWLVGGHSVGGITACMYVSKNPDEIDGVALLGSYSESNLSGFTGSVLTAYGTNDNIIDPDKYDKAKANLPNGFRETVIDGGNHAYFGNYGEQAGDGTATITREEQQAQAVRAIVELAKAA